MTDRYLSDEDRDALVIAVDFRQSASDVLNIVESLIRRHRAAAWREGFHAGYDYDGTGGGPDVIGPQWSPYHSEDGKQIQDRRTDSNG